jgi:2-polyprenyl-3-methyl-5-hydroxy-6-metoxy-1,4-benzoquinol methylase
MDFCGKDYDLFIESFIAPLGPLKILDVGCGTGDRTILLKGSDGKVFGTDIVDVRKNAYRRIFSFFLSKIGKIEAGDKEFDLVTNMDVLEHVEDDKSFVKEMYRVTKFGGHVLTLTPNKYRLSNILRIILRFRKLEYPMNLGKDVYGDCIHVREYTVKELKDLFIKTGFESVKVKPFWFGLRFPLVDRIRIAYSIPFPLSLVAQYIVVDATK